LPQQTAEIARRLQGSFHPGDNYPHAMINQELAQLCQSVGQSRYAPASSVLKRLLPKSIKTGSESRSAAAWALGYIHEKSPSASVTEALIDRVGDDSAIDPEDPVVRRMSAVSLGRMKAQDAIGVLEKYYAGEPSIEVFPIACGWALERITGKKLTPPGVIKAVQVGWFLEPIN
jgi:hypothetical protein